MPAINAAGTSEVWLCSQYLLGFLLTRCVKVANL